MNSTQRDKQPVPEKIGRFLVEGLFREGGLSKLFLARNPETSELVVIKTLKASSRFDPQARELFLKESKLIDLPEHPNIIKIIELGESEEEGPFICMEFVRGANIHTLIKTSPFPLRRALDILLQICYALSHLHLHNIIHGDLKPENILISELGQVKLIDIGITASTLGTPLYMSPEQHQDIALAQPASPTFQSDIYSLGILAFELVMGKITHGKVVISSAPKGLQPILAKALQPDPSKRYPQMIDLIEDLSRYIHSGELKKDRQGADYFFELYDELETARKKLLESNWKERTATNQVGFSSSAGVGLYGLFAGIRGEETIDLLFAKMKHFGASGIIDAYCLQTLWDIKATDNSLQKYTSEYSSLHIDKRNLAWEITHQSFGYFFLCKENQIVEMKPKGSFNTDDTIIYIGAAITHSIEFPSTPLPPSTSHLKSLLEGMQNYTPQQCCDTLLQKLRLLGIATLETSPVCLFSFSLRSI